MTFTSAVLGRTGEGGRAIALIGVLACAVGIGVGIVIAPLATFGAAVGVVALVGLVYASEHRPAWSLAAALFGIQLGTVWLPAWHGRRLVVSTGDLLIVLLVLLTVFRIVRRVLRPRRSPLDVWWAVYIFALIPSLWMTRDYLWWIAEMRVIFQDMLVFYLVFEMIGTLAQARALGRMLVAWGGVGAITLIHTTFSAPEGYAYILMYKMTDVPWARSNYFASFMLVVAAVGFSMSMHENRRAARWLLQAMTAVMLVGVVLTRSVGATLVGAICVTAWMFTIRGRQLSRLLGIALLVGGIALAGSLLFSDVASKTVGDLPGVLRNLLQEQRTLGRVEIWQYNLDLFKQSPLIGNGLGNAVLYRPHSPFAWAEAHNYIIQTMAETGLVGLFGFVLLWWHVSVGLIKTWRAAPQATWQRGLLLGILMGVAAALMHGMIEPNILTKDFGVLIWAVIGLGFAVGRIQAGGQIPGNAISH